MTTSLFILDLVEISRIFSALFWVGLGVAPDELEYGGLQEGLSYRLVLFSVDKPGHPLHRTTRSVKVMV